MPLITPILDDRTYAQLRAELVRRIPVYTPEWTDFNETDPGIALVDLFAYLGESLLYRFNQIPDATKIAFLRLLGVQPRPAQCARTWVRLETERADGVQVLRGVAAPAGAVPFETDDEVFVWPVDLLGAVKVRAPEPTGDPAAKEAERRRRADAAQGRVPAGQPYDVYTTRLVPEDPADPAAVSVDVGTTLDQSLWVAVLGKATTDLAPMRGRTLFVGVAVDEDLARPYALEPVQQDDPARLPAGRLTADPPAMLWELWVEGGRAVPLRVSGDTSRGLTTSGVVKLDLPQEFPTQAVAARTPGDRDAPPPLDDEKVARRVVAWVRVRRPGTEDETMRRIRWVGANVVGVVQARTAVPELLGTGTGEAGQAYRLSQRPVVAGSLRVEVEEADGWVPWEEVRTLATSEPLDRHYTLERDTGVVRFGVRNRVPQLGERIRAATYRHGGGSAGNVGAGAITSLVGVASVKVDNPMPAVGGADAASLAEALDTVPAEVHRRDRAVVAEDFRALALEVPGVVRADARPLLHPDTPRRPAAGVVSVVVFPAEDPREPGAPLPDVSLLRRVAAYLDPRRLMTTELYVIPPTYVDIALSVGVAVKPGYQVDAVRRWVDQLLRQYLSPLPPAGPEGQGWPLGRAVRRAELEAVSVQVAGVEYVEDELLLAVPDGSGGWLPTPLVRLEPWEVPRVVQLAVVSGPPLPPGSGYAAPPRPEDVPLVPLPPDVCS